MAENRIIDDIFCKLLILEYGVLHNVFVTIIKTP